MKAMPFFETTQAWWLGLGLAVLAPFVAVNDYLLHMMVLWGIYSILALSLNIIVGFLGELTFGHAGNPREIIVGMNFTKTGNFQFGLDLFGLIVSML